MTKPVALLGLALLACAPARPDPEVDRLQRHFAVVERELMARDLSALTPAQREARARHIAELRAYAQRGVFPKNTDFPGQRVPYFIDRRGTRCAMAHLIEQSGHGEFVARVADTRNNAYVAQLASEPELLPWLEQNGLTAAEAARIQPAYCNIEPCPVDPPPSEPTVSASYKVGSGAAVLGGVSTIALNLSLLQPGVSRRAGGWLGMGAGTLGLALGVSKMGEGGAYGTLGPLNAAVGALSVLAGILAINQADVAPARFGVMPWTTPERAGLIVRARF